MKGTRTDDEKNGKDGKDEETEKADRPLPH
ncbi:hypothetical protein ThrDRAFT_01939 [Frankia casuarinae]|nr:hypothetical protein CcI6DRAFT_02338 [Frankia sp. CcI6]EYT92329.1 hypothetical protein ThrDRAFT_01939 [Frankia casuarinae]KDA42846.1 hypothetical protein BMG523Draft_02235 [Frankia sp. BMG5.23]OAA28923.1 hypothetical protein AAY23_101888 [Frankia casuarinae]